MRTKRAISILLITTMLLALIPYTITVSAINVPEVYNEAGTILAINEGIVITPGTTLNVTGGGVTSGSSVSIYWDTVGAAYEVNVTTGKPNGKYSCFIDVPETALGNHYVWVRDGMTSSTASSARLYVNQTISVDPSSGLVGDPIEVTGKGFAGSEDVIIWFSNTQVSTSFDTNSAGSFVASFDVPSGHIYGTYQIMANVSNAVANTTFTVGASIIVDKDSGPSGMVLKITGRGFGNSVTIEDKKWNVTINMGGNSWQMFTRDGSSWSTSGTGTFTTYVIVPSVAKGDYTVNVTDGPVSLNTAYDKFEVDGTTDVTLSQDYGTPGTVVTVTGSNYTQVSGTSVTITIGGVTQGSTTTDANGDWSIPVSLPALGLGAKYDVWGNDTRNNNGSKSILIALIMLQLNVAVGPVGSNFTLSGTGLNNTLIPVPVQAQYSVNFSDIPILPITNTAMSANPPETLPYFSRVFQVPQVPAGTYTIYVRDEVSDIIVSTAYTVTDQTSLTPSRVDVPNGYNVSFAGVNYPNLPGSTLTWFIYNSTWAKQIAPTYGGVAATVMDDGSFTGYYRVQWNLELGTYTVNASATINNGGTTYKYVEETNITVVPETLKISPGKTAYGRGEVIFWTIRAMFAKNIMFGIWDDANNIIYNDSWAPGQWSTLGTEVYIPIGDQDGWLVPHDAEPGNWNWDFRDINNTVLASNILVIKERTDVEELQDSVALLSGSVGNVSGAVESLANTVGEVSAAVSDAAAAAADAAAAASDAQTAANAAATAVADVAETASAALDAANNAKSAADSAKTAADSSLAAANDAKTQAQAAADAATGAKDAAEGAQKAASGLTTLVYGAIGASLIAALAAIVSLMQISRRIAG